LKGENSPYISTTIIKQNLRTNIKPKQKKNDIRMTKLFSV